jgi:hypothetical protein
MTSLKSRIEAMENEYLFSEWLRFERFLESLTEEQLKELAINWRFPDPLPEPMPQGASRLDCLDRNTLMKLFRENELRRAQFHLHSHEDQEFFCSHAHWPEEACTQDCLEVSNPGWRVSKVQRQGGTTE